MADHVLVCYCMIVHMPDSGIDIALTPVADCAQWVACSHAYVCRVCACMHSLVALPLRSAREGCASMEHNLLLSSDASCSGSVCLPVSMPTPAPMHATTPLAVCSAMTLLLYVEWL
jgi:hypothetical protein